MVNFIRTKHYAYACLGKRQKSKRKYRRPTGRHNKMRQKWKGRTPMVEVGYKNSEKLRGLIQGKIPILIQNVNDLTKIGKNNIIILANVGDRKKIEIVKQAQEKKLDIANFNLNKFLKKMKRQEKFRKKTSVKPEVKKQEEKPADNKENKEAKK